MGWVKEFEEGVNRIFEEMQEFYLDDPEYIVTNTSTDLVLKNNIVMRTVRRDKALQNKLGKVWDNLTFVEQMAIVQVYEHGEVRTKSLAESNDKISVQMARRALKNLTDKKILKRIATAPTAPNQYYVLAEDK
nr:winged helix-turn-helix transcriptional regulator [Ligilactobacillus murinus]